MGWVDGTWVEGANCEDAPCCGCCGVSADNQPSDRDYDYEEWMTNE